MSRAGIAAVMLALGVAGCGSSSTSLAPLRRNATRVCERSLARSDAITPPALPAGTAPFLRRGATALRAELAGLRTLKPPADDGASYNTALGAMSNQLGTLDETVRDLDHGADPLATIKALQRRLAPAESTEDAAWHELGIPGCVTR
jgi:hypothetical protein